jgi:hypothetical protein
MSQYINVKGDATNTDYFRDIHTMLNKHVSLDSHPTTVSPNYSFLTL